jgi:hypothetical protein
LGPAGEACGHRVRLLADARSGAVAFLGAPFHAPVHGALRATASGQKIVVLLPRQGITLLKVAHFLMRAVAQKFMRAREYAGYFPKTIAYIDSVVNQ